MTTKDEATRYHLKPIRKEIQNDETFTHWFNVRLTDKAKNTRTNAEKALAAYIYYLRNEYHNHVMPVELIDEAYGEQRQDIPAYRKTLPKYLNGFIEYIYENYKQSVQEQQIGYVKDFYIANDIFLDRKSFKPKKPDFDDDDYEEVDKVNNTYHLKKSEINKALKACSKFLRVYALCQISSGISGADLVRLRVKDFKEGYDERYKICKINIKRKKVTSIDYHSFFSIECCEAIIDYLNYRQGYGKDYDELTDREKTLYIYSDDDALFSRPEPRYKFLEYVDDSGYTKMYEVKDKENKEKDEENKKKKKPKLISPDKKFRKFKSKELARYFQDVSDDSDLYKKGEYSYFRQHNLRRYFSTTLKNVDECKYDFKEHWMGHKQGSGDFYDKYDDETSMEQYLKIMKFLTISAAEEVQIYKNREHQNEIEFLEKRINLTKMDYEQSIMDINANIESYERELADINMQLKNDKLNFDAVLILRSQKQTVEGKIERLKKTIESKKTKYEYELQQLEREREDINNKYNQDR